MYIDTHCHILSKEYDNIDKIIEEIEDNIAIISGYDYNSNLEVIELSKRYKNIYGTIGIHPSETKDFNKKTISLIEKNIDNPKIVGIGEIGLDYHYGKEEIELQKEMFIQQLELAKKYHKPVVIHSRDAAKDTFDIIKKYSNLKITYHCYSYSKEMAKELEKMNIKFGIGGVLTFKNSKTLKEVVENISLNSILLETDSPYLTPEPYRGKKNNPTNVKIIAKKISEIKNIPYETILKETTKNAISQFDLNI